MKVEFTVIVDVQDKETHPTARLADSSGAMLWLTNLLRDKRLETAHVRMHVERVGLAGLPDDEIEGQEAEAI